MMYLHKKELLPFKKSKRESEKKNLKIKMLIKSKRKKIKQTNE